MEFQLTNASRGRVRPPLTSGYSIYGTTEWALIRYNVRVKGHAIMKNPVPVFCVGIFLTVWIAD